MEHKLLCTGDPILDVYIDNKNNMNTFKGGALNVYHNLLALLEEYWSSGSANSFLFAYPNDGDTTPGDIFTHYTIVRTPSEKEGVHLVSNYEKDIFYEPSGIAELIVEFKPTILLLADYNKGALTATYDIQLPEIPVAIIDSKYRSLDLHWISTCKYKIWHATGSEYDEDWAENFDIVFWTNGSHPVRVIKNKKIIKTLDVPSGTEVVNTCGSGDTFTATIAACIYAYNNLSDESLIDYAKFAIEVCQDVVSMPYTSTTNKRIKKECTLQI